MGANTSQYTLPRLIEENLEGYLAAFMVGIYWIMIVWNILARNLFGSGLQIPDQLSITLGLISWVSWLAASWGIRKQAHLRFLLLRDRLSRQKQYLSYVLEWALWLFINGIILWLAIPLIERRLASGATTPQLAVPTWLFYLSIPVGFSLILVRTLQMAYIVTQQYRRGEDIQPTSEIE